MTTVVHHVLLWSVATSSCLLVFSPVPTVRSQSSSNIFTSALDSFSSGFSNASGNGLWTDLVGKCDGPRNTMDCVRSRLYNYVDHAFDGDFNITDGLKFTKNSNNYDALCPGNNDTAGSHRQARASEAENEVPDDDGWSDVTDHLYNKGAKYLVTHDFEATVPSFLAGGPGARVRLSPKKILPDGGIILRMDVLPAEREARSPRFMHKMIKQLFKKKLMSSAMAMMLIMKLIKIKVIFLLPLLIGAGAAKKILLKVLLFLFPPLAHLFKLCSFYHHHASKFHHFHHHKVKHHHHHLKVPVPIPVPVKAPIYHGDYYPGPTLDHPPTPYDSPEILTGDYYNRLDLHNVASDNADELASWGLGEYGDGAPNSGQSSGLSQYEATKYNQNGPPPPPTSQYDSVKTYGPNGPPPPPASSQYDSVKTYSQNGPPHYDASKFSSHNGPPPFAEKYVKRVDDQHAVVSRPPAHDPVFTPVVQKLDEIFHELAVPEEPCKEKLVCKMYGNPSKFSPHSNLVSAQLSSETAASSGGRTVVSADAARLWRYVLAAKEGQNGEDCRVLYPTCNMLGL